MALDQWVQSTNPQIQLMASDMAALNERDEIIAYAIDEHGNVISQIIVNLNTLQGEVSENTQAIVDETSKINQLSQDYTDQEYSRLNTAMNKELNYRDVEIQTLKNQLRDMQTANNFVARLHERQLLWTWIGAGSLLVLAFIGTLLVWLKRY